MPLTALGGNKKQTKKKNLSRNDSNHRGFRVSFTDKNRSRSLIEKTQKIIQNRKSIDATFKINFSIKNFFELNKLVSNKNISAVLIFNNDIGVVKFIKAKCSFNKKK